MKNIKIDYSSEISLNEECKRHIKRADICKGAISENRPFTDEKLKTIAQFFRTSITWSSNALEGFTYTIGETQTLLEYGVTIHGKSLKETLEVCGHAAAFDHMVELSKKKGLTKDDILHMHQLIYEKADGEIAGTYKKEQNFISGSNYTTVSPKNVGEEMDKLENWIAENYDKLHPIVLAAEIHRKLVYIHPFDNGNGRCARLCMNVVLMQNGYLPCSVSPSLRLDYINTLESGRAGNYNEFIRFVAEAETETQKDYIRALDLKMPQLPSPSADSKAIEITGPKL